MYIGIALKWCYEKGTVQISLPGYVSAELHYFQHEKPKLPQESPYPWTQPVYGKTIRCYHKKHYLNSWIKIVKKDFRNL